MEKINTILTALRKNPVYTIGVILAVALFIFGLYSVGPWYVGGATSVIGQVFEDPMVRAFVSLFYIIPSAGVIIGTTKKSWRRWSTFGTALAYIFLALLRLLTIGFVPFIWLFILASGLVMGVVYIHISVRSDERVVDNGLL